MCTLRARVFLKISRIMAFEIAGAELDIMLLHEHSSEAVWMVCTESHRAQPINKSMWYPSRAILEANWSTPEGLKDWVPWKRMRVHIDCTRSRVLAQASHLIFQLQHSSGDKRDYHDYSVCGLTPDLSALIGKRFFKIHQMDSS